MIEYRADAATASHTGCVREENEDSLLADGDGFFWVVTDGMGGHENGKLASEKVVAALAAAEIPVPFEDACSALARTIDTANSEIFEYASEGSVQMGTTVVALVLRGSQFAVLWAGDSRAYVFRDGVLVQLTRDHTHVEEMLARGLLDEEDAADHPMKHVLARAVGVTPELELEAVRDDAQPGDIFLLCSDGLHGVLDEVTIARFLGERGTAAAGELVQATLELGAPDNVTVIVVQLHEVTLLNLGGYRP